MRKAYKILIPAVAILALAAGGGYFVIKKYNLTDKYGCYVSDDDVYNGHQKNIKNFLKSPSSAKFADIKEAKISHNSKCEFFIESYVDSQNGYGAYLRTNYLATVLKTGSAYQLVTYYQKNRYQGLEDYIFNLKITPFNDVLEKFGIGSQYKIDSKKVSGESLTFDGDDGNRLTINLTHRFKLVKDFELEFNSSDRDEITRAVMLSFVMTTELNPEMSKIEKKYFFKRLTNAIKESGNKKGTSAFPELDGYLIKLKLDVSKPQKTYKYTIKRLGAY